MARYITLSATKRRVTLSSYVRVIKHAKANPDAQFKHGLTTWWPVSGREIVEQFRKGMIARINAGISYSQRGV